MEAEGQQDCPYVQRQPELLAPAIKGTPIARNASTEKTFIPADSKGYAVLREVPLKVNGAYITLHLKISTSMNQNFGAAALCSIHQSKLQENDVYSNYVHTSYCQPWGVSACKFAIAPLARETVNARCSHPRIRLYIRKRTQDNAKLRALVVGTYGQRSWATAV